MKAISPEHPNPDKPIVLDESGLPPVSSWFLGPKAEHAEVWQRMFDRVFQDYIHWRRNYFPDDPILRDRTHRSQHLEWHNELDAELTSMLGALKAHFPFYSPRYMGHMLAEQTMPSVLGYLAGMLYNPNNVTDEAAPVTVRLELEVGRIVSEMLGYNPRRAWAHICSGGTTANLEALWVARNVQFAPLIAQEYCRHRNIPFQLEMPNRQKCEIEDLTPAELLELKPSQSAGMLGKLVAHVQEEAGESRKKVVSEVTAAVRSSAFNPATRGIYYVLRAIELSPVIFVSAAAHYSIKKAANVLGYGEDSVEIIPVTDRFRMNTGALYDRICSLPGNRYIAAVIGIAGTTEEGAVDPLHEIHFMQQKSCKERNRAFWFHVDAAWGGYFRCLFRGHELPGRETKGDLKAICSDYMAAIGATETFNILLDSGNSKELKSAWNDPEIYSAFLAMGDADSITVDPHKMGYAPYPAGIVAFKNASVTQLMTQRAQYISDEQQEVEASDRMAPITAVGPYILEGSKPGAAAAGCWLAHTAIPLTHKGHGRIVRASLLSARRLNSYLSHHKDMFRRIDRELFANGSSCRYPFTFVTLYEPDTNVICYVTLPMIWQNRTLMHVDMPLERVNALNERIYQELSIPGSASVTQPVSGKSRLPYLQSYFVSRTRLEENQYASGWIRRTLDRLCISEKEYKAHGLFVLRSAVMNPLYQLAESEGRDYLLDFVKHLHQIARSLIPGTCWLYGETES